MVLKSLSKSTLIKSLQMLSNSTIKNWVKRLAMTWQPEITLLTFTKTFPDFFTFSLTLAKFRFSCTSEKGETLVASF